MTTEMRTGQTVRWNDDDAAAPATPWGPAQHAKCLADGVVWYDTAGHGGLSIRADVAGTVLTAAARSCGDFDGEAYWFEEDVLCSVPFHEHPEWTDICTAAETELFARENVPEYFARLAMS